MRKSKWIVSGKRKGNACVLLSLKTTKVARGSYFWKVVGTEQRREELRVGWA